MKKLFKKSIACLIAVLMVFSSLPITAFAKPDNPLSIKTGVTIAGYENNYGLMYYSNQKVDYAFSVIKEADKNGVITVEKGNGFQITQSFGTWVNDNNTAAGDTAIASKGLHWHYGDSSDYALGSSLDHGNNAVNIWNAHLKGDTSKPIQSAVGGTLANKSTQNSFRATSGDGGANEATGIYSFTPDSFPQLNTPGEYTIQLWSTVSFMEWKYNPWPTKKWCSIYATQNPVEVTIRVVDRYTFNKIDGSSTDVLALNADAAKAKAPALASPTAKTHKDGTDQHAWTEYSWVQNGNTFTETGSEKTEACAYGEVKSEITKAPTCTEKGVKTCNKTCAVCNYNKVWTEDIVPTDHTYVYTPATVSEHTVTCEKGDLEASTVSHNFNENNTCIDCGMTVDFSTFDAAVATLEAELEKTEIYTEESVAQVQEILNNALTSKDNCANQDALDALAATLTESLELLERAAYSITFSSDVDGLTSVEECAYEYGDVVTFTAPAGKVLKWTVEAQNGTTNLGTTAQSIDYVVTRDAVITVFVTQKAESETEKFSKVTFEGHNGAVVAVMYVKEGETLDTSKVVAPAISFYESKGWNKATVTGTGSDITVRAIYKAVGTEKCTVTFGDFRKDYDYDAFVYLKDADENTRYAMYDSNDNLLTYFVGKEFYAPHTDAIVIKEATEDTATSAITGYYKDGTKLVYNSKFYLPENTTLVKAGVEVTVNGKTVNFYADKVSARNEFSYAIDFGSLTGVEVKARSFVEYMDGGEQKIAYSNTTMTQNI